MHWEVTMCRYLAKDYMYSILNPYYNLVSIYRLGNRLKRLVTYLRFHGPPKILTEV